MRELRFQTKTAKVTAIPAWLIRFFTRVNKMILKKDDAAMRASDDFIQQRGVVGGLVEDGGNIYEFTVFPGPDDPDNRPRWYVTVSADSIQDIADKKLNHLNLWECSNVTCQNLFSSPEAVCMYCDYYDDARDARNQIKAELSKLTFRKKEEWVHAYLRHFPDEHPLILLGQYNSTGLGEKLGWFTSNGIDSVVNEYNAHVHDPSCK